MAPRAGADCHAQGDDDSIGDEDVLWRRIPPTAVVGGAEPRPNTGNFRDSDGELSVAVAALTERDLILDGHDGYLLVAFTAGHVRALGEEDEYVVRMQPTDDDPSHAVICPKLTKTAARQLCKICQWV